MENARASSKLSIDSEALQEKRYEASRAYTDKYQQVDILTNESHLIQESILQKKKEERLQLKEGIIFTQKEEYASYDKVLQDMVRTPIFTSQIRYEVLGLQEQKSKLPLFTWILFLCCMGGIGFWMAILSKKRRGKGKDVH